jgi:flavorubredoxin
MSNAGAWQTRVDEVADGLYRFSTGVPPSVVPGGFTFNQFLLVDEEPLLFHTGMRELFPTVSAAVARVLPLERLRWVSFSHWEADESGALNLFLAAAPHARPVCGQAGAMTTVQDQADRAPHVLADGETLSLGKRQVTWLDAAHLPHNWECGYLFESHTRTLLCGDLLTQPGSDLPPITRSDVLGPAEAMRQAMPDSVAPFGRPQRARLQRLCATEPRLLACMHGSAYEGDGAAMLRAFGEALAAAS